MIFLKQVILRRGSKILLDGASITINPGEKVGLVGRNGAGKSSLFALLNRSLHEDGGEFSIPTQWRMSEVAQNMPETEESATNYVIAGDTALLAAQEEVDVDYEHEALDVGFNVSYLLDFLANVKAETIRWSVMPDANASALITLPDDESFKYVVMPMRI